MTLAIIPQGYLEAGMKVFFFKTFNNIEAVTSVTTLTLLVYSEDAFDTVIYSR